jgi:hypothetical protein
MNHLEHAFGRPRPPKDTRPWWKRLLCSIRPEIKIAPDRKRPIRYVGVKGKLDF